MPEATDGFDLHALERVGQPPPWSGSRALPLGWTVVTAFHIENLFNPTTTKWVDKRNFAYLFSNDQAFGKPPGALASGAPASGARWLIEGVGLPPSPWYTDPVLAMMW